MATQTQTRYVRLDPDTLAAVEKMAAAEGRAIANMLSRLVTEAVWKRQEAEGTDA